jgi:hypothetical protein
MAISVDPLLPVLANLLGGSARLESPPIRAQVLSLPTQLLQAQVPVSVSGTVVDSPIPGRLRISTPLGDVQLRASTEIPVGRPVTVVTRPTLPTEVFLLQQPATASAPAPQTNTVPRSGVPAQPAVAAPATFPAASQPAPVPASQAGPAAPSLSANGPPGTAGAAAFSAAAAAATKPAPTAADAARVLPYATPAPPTAVPARTASSPTLSPGSLLATLGLAAVPQAAASTVYAAPKQPGPASELLALLTDLRRLVAAKDPKLAERLLQRLPTPDRPGVLAMLTLPVAAERGRLAPWVGREIAALARETGDAPGGDLLERIAANLSTRAERVEEGDDRIWRWRQVPLADHGHIIPVFIGVAQSRNQADKNGDRPRPSGRIVEFAVEFVLAAFGRTRIDAVHRPHRLDLVVHSESEIDPEGRQQIVTAIAAVFDEFGFGGSCRFAPYRADASETAIKV